MNTKPLPPPEHGRFRGVISCDSELARQLRELAGLRSTSVTALIPDLLRATAPAALQAERARSASGGAA